MTEQYATATEFRNVSNLGSEEYADTALDQLLDAATTEIDARTGRTWQGIQTETDELYDGNGQTYLYLNQVDIQSITALSVNEDLDNTFTSITTSYIRVYSDIGRIELDVENSDSANLIEVNNFITGPKTVKISYTYGFATPTDDVKNLCILMVEQRITSLPERGEEIIRRINRLRAFQITDAYDV